MKILRLILPFLVVCPFAHAQLLWGNFQGAGPVVADGSGHWNVQKPGWPGQVYNVRAYGAKGDGNTDDTAAIQAAINASLPSGVLYIPPGFYLVGQLVVSGANTYIIDDQGVLVGRSSGTFDSVLTIKNSTAVVVSGALVISGSYNVGYACGLAVYTDNATSATDMSFASIGIVGCQLATRWGRSTEVSPTISEITVYGGYTFGCPSVVQVWGTQTVITFQGTDLIAEFNGGNSAWQALPQNTIRCFGGTVNVNGGEVLCPEVTTGADMVVEPIADPVNGHNYGVISVDNAVCESAKSSAVAQNTLSVTSPAAGVGYIRLTGCYGFHSQDLFAFIQTASDYTGTVSLSGCNFYCSVPERTST